MLVKGGDALGVPHAPQLHQAIGARAEQLQLQNSSLMQGCIGTLWDLPITQSCLEILRVQCVLLQLCMQLSCMITGLLQFGQHIDHLSAG